MSLFINIKMQSATYAIYFMPFRLRNAEGRICRPFERRLLEPDIDAAVILMREAISVMLKFTSHIQLSSSPPLPVMTR